HVVLHTPSLHDALPIFNGRRLTEMRRILVSKLFDEWASMVASALQPVLFKSHKLLRAIRRCTENLTGHVVFQQVGGFLHVQVARSEEHRSELQSPDHLV